MPVERDRPRLAAAALTILAGYCAADRPDVGIPPWRSFEAWSGLVRQAMVWAGMPDPTATRRELQNRADQDAMVLTMFLDGLEEMDSLGHGVSPDTWVVQHTHPTPTR